MVPSLLTRRQLLLAGASIAGLTLVVAGVVIGVTTSHVSGRAADSVPSLARDPSTLGRTAALASLSAPPVTDPATRPAVPGGLGAPPGPQPAPAPDPSLASVPPLRLAPRHPAQEPTGQVDQVLSLLTSLLDRPAPATPASSEPVTETPPVRGSPVEALPVAPSLPPL